MRWIWLVMIVGCGKPEDHSDLAPPKPAPVPAVECANRSPADCTGPCEGIAVGCDMPRNGSDTYIGCDPTFACRKRPPCPTGAPARVLDGCRLRDPSYVGIDSRDARVGTRILDRETFDKAAECATDPHVDWKHDYVIAVVVRGERLDPSVAIAGDGRLLVTDDTACRGDDRGSETIQKLVLMPTAAPAQVPAVCVPPPSCSGMEK